MTESAKLQGAYFRRFKMLENKKTILNKAIFTSLNQTSFGFNFIELENGNIQNTLNNESRAALYDEHFASLLGTLNELLFGVHELNEDDDDYANKSQVVNAHMLFCTGLGKHPFILDEMMPAKHVYQFKTVYDYMAHCHDEKVQCQAEQSQATEPCLVEFDIGDWIQFFDQQNNFHYGNLYSPINYLYRELDSDALIAELIPHTYAEGPNHNQEIKLDNGDCIYEWDMILEANGLEKLLHSYKVRFKDKLITAYELGLQKFN